jgi:hypothetical protein
MAESGYIQPELFSPANDAPENVGAQQTIALQPSDLQTALDILELAETVEDLKLLETLTEPQKRQVWAATTEMVRQKIKHIREAGNRDATISQPSCPTSLPHPASEPPFHNGDHIVLKAKPSVTTAELLAIFEVMQVEGTLVQVKAKEVGMRRYPLDWCLLYRSRSTAPLE